MPFFLIAENRWIFSLQFFFCFFFSVNFSFFCLFLEISFQSFCDVPIFFSSSFFFSSFCVRHFHCHVFFWLKMTLDIITITHTHTYTHHTYIDVFDALHKEWEKYYKYRTDRKQK